MRSLPPDLDKPPGWDECPRDYDCENCDIVGSMDICNTVEIAKPTQIELSKEMIEIKNNFPTYKEGGPTQKQIYQAGLLKFKNEYKFSRENDLFDLLEDVFN